MENEQEKNDYVSFQNVSDFAGPLLSRRVFFIST